MAWRLTNERFGEVAAAVALAVCIAALAWWWVPGQNGAHDSAYYIEGARHLAAGDGYVTGRIDPGAAGPWKPIARYPPGFSALQVPGVWLGLGVEQSGAWVLGLSAVALALLTYALLRSVGAGRWSVALPGAWIAAANKGALRSLDAVLSDLTFAAVGTAAVLALVRLERRFAGPAAYGLLGLLLGAACLVRWAGLYLLAGVCVAVLWSARVEGRVRAGVVRAGCVAAGTGLLVAPWLVRNLWLTGSPAGRQASIELESVFHMMQSSLRTVAKLFYPYERVFAGTPVLDALGYVIFGLAAVLFIGLLVKVGPSKIGAARATLAAAGVYWLLMSVTAALHLLYPITSARFWLVIPGLLLAAAVALIEQGGLTEVWRRRARGALVALIALSVWPQLEFARGGLERADRTRGWLSRERRDSAPLRFLREPGIDCRVAANERRLVLIHYDRGPVGVLPTELDEARRLVESGDRVCLVLITRDLSRRMRPTLPVHQAIVAELEREGSIRVAARDDWGVVFVSAPE